MYKGDHKSIHMFTWSSDKQTDSLQLTSQPRVAMARGELGNRTIDYKS